jgi:hypothetical protein
MGRGGAADAAVVAAAGVNTPSRVHRQGTKIQRRGAGTFGFNLGSPEKSMNHHQGTRTQRENHGYFIRKFTLPIIKRKKFKHLI